MRKVTLEQLVKLPSFKILANPDIAMRIQIAILDAGFKWQGGSTQVRMITETVHLLFLDGQMCWVGDSIISKDWFHKQLIKEVGLVI